MKKISVMLAVFIVIILLSVSFAFSEDNFDKETAIEKISEFSNIYDSMKVGFRWFEGFKPGDNINKHIWDEDLINIEIEREMEDRNGEMKKYTIIRHYLPVAEGYSEEGLKDKIRGLFVEPLATKIIDGSDYFFDLYLHENGKDYYNVQFATQSDPYNDKPYMYFTEEDIKECRIVSQGNGSATVTVTARCYEYSFYDPLPDPPIAELDYIFNFVKVGDDWKIESYDYTGVFFSERNISTKGAFTEDLALSCIKGVVYDTYYYMIMGAVPTGIDFGNKERFYFDMDTKEVSEEYVSGLKSLWRLDEVISDPSVWKNHALNFCSKEIAEKIISYNGPMYTYKGKVFLGYSRNNNKLYRTDFDIKKFSTDNLEIVSMEDGKATVTYVLQEVNKYDYSKRPVWQDIGPVTMHFVFTETSDGWKITESDFYEVLNEAYGIVPNDPADAIETLPETADDSCYFMTLALLSAVTVYYLFILKRRLTKSSIQ